MESSYAAWSQPAHFDTVLIEDFHIRLEAPPWEPGSANWTAFAQFGVDIAPVLPYLNATVSGALYEHDAPALFWRTEQRLVCFHPHQIAVSNLRDRDHAATEVAALVRLVNETWESRGSIEPVLVRREPLKALDVYKLLPRQYCLSCGDGTCFTFALKLSLDQVELRQCPRLWTEAFAPNLHRLQAMLREAGRCPGEPPDSQ